LNPSLTSLFAIVDVLGTRIVTATKTILAQLGDVIGEQTESDDAEWFQQPGFVSRPPKAVPGQKATQAVAIRRSDNDIIIAARDSRAAELAANLDDGESCIYAAGPDGTGQARILVKGSGAVSLYTAQGNAAGGASCTIQLTADGAIQLASPKGAIAISADGSIKALTSTTPAAGLALDGTGVTLIGQAMALNGASVGLGAAPVHPVAYGDIIAAQNVALLSLSSAIAVAFATPPATLVAGAPAVVTACGVLTTALGLPVTSPSVTTT